MSVTVEIVEEKYFEQIATLRKEFLDSKHLCCILPLGMGSLSEIRKSYGKNPELMQVAAVAILPDQGVVGYVQVILHGMPCDIHKPEKEEAYIYHLAVDSSARGKGVGSALMAWTEDLAKQRGCTFMSLEVIHNNPAIRLYERKGYVVQPSSLFSQLSQMPFLCCIFGPLICPSASPSYWSHGRVHYMKKQLE